MVRGKGGRRGMRRSRWVLMGEGGEGGEELVGNRDGVGLGLLKSFLICVWGFCLDIRRCLSLWFLHYQSF